jgi:hypothetical protein
VKVTPILRDKRRRHPKAKDVECHKSLLALDRFLLCGLGSVDWSTESHILIQRLFDGGKGL